MAARAVRGWLRHMYAPDAYLQMDRMALETMGLIATGNRLIMLIEGSRFHPQDPEQDPQQDL
jgi:hypothetical protein